MPSNRIDATLTDEHRDKAMAALATLAEVLPFLIDLSPKERADSPKFGEKNRSFVSQALAVAEEHPEIFPASFSLAELRNDVQLVEAMYPLRHTVKALFRKIDDTYLAAGSEAYAAALAVYQYAKQHNVTGDALEDSLDDLGRRFARKTRKSAPPA
jgi:hypothetical protein